MRTTGTGTPAAVTKEGRIITWKDDKGVCHTTTTPFIKANKVNGDNVRWRIVDDYDCTEPEDVTIEIKFDKDDPNPFVAGCVLSDDRKIQCELRPDAIGRILDYSVWIGMEQEDPELQIEM